MQLYSADINILRDQNLEPNPLNSGAEEESVLLEYYSRNGLFNSNGGAGISASFATIDTGQANAPDGGSLAFNLTEDSNNANHSAFFGYLNTVDPTVNTCTVFAKAGTRTKCFVAGNGSGGQDPCIINLSTGSKISGPATAIVTVTDVGNGWFRIDRTVAANQAGQEKGLGFGLVDNSDNISYAGDGTGFATFWCAIDGMNRPIGSSPIISTANQAGSPVPSGFPDTAPSEFNFGTGRYLDSSFQIPFIYAPQEMSGLLEFIEKGTVQTIGAGLWSIGDYVLSIPSLQIGLGTTGYQIKHISGGTVSSVLATKPTIGQLVRLRFSLNADGSVQIWQSLNGAAETTPGASAANALGVAWSEGYSWLNGLGASNQGFVAFRQMVVLPGDNISQADLLSHFT